MVLTRLLNKLALRRKRPGFRSQFGGFWPDRPEALERIERDLADGTLSAVQAVQLRSWIQDGYLILPGAVPTDLCDRLNAELEERWTAEDKSVLIELDGVHHPLDPALRDQHYKLVDFYHRSQTALACAFAPAVNDFLRLVFERDVLLFQSLSFEWGSGDPVHQDTAYVVVQSPLEFAAGWIALEDIQPNTGELCYYPGSHRLPEEIFSSGARNWNRRRDGIDSRTRYLEGLHTRSKEMGLELERFLPKKGDALIWSADLAHGSSPITDRSHTRKSFVCHYCPRDVTPYYFNTHRAHRTVRTFGANGHYASSHYRL